MQPAKDHVPEHNPSGTGNADRRRRYVLGVGLILVLSVAVFTWRTMNTRRTAAALVIQSIRPVAKAVLVEGVAMVTLKHASPIVGTEYGWEEKLPRLFRRQFFATQTGLLIVGFDLTDWDPSRNVEVDVNGKKVRVTMPPPQLLYVQRDPSTREIVVAAGFFRSQDIGPDEDKELDMRLDKLFRESERIPELNREAIAQLQQRLEKALTPYGFMAEVAFGG